MIVRMAQEGDFEQAGRLMRRFISHHPELGVHASSSEELASIMREMDAAGTGKTIVADAAGAIAGILVVAFLASRLFSHSVLAQEVCFYIDGSFRGGDTASRMLRMAEDEARSRGAKMFVMVYEQWSRPDSTKRFYERQGFRTMEVMMMKEV